MDAISQSDDTFSKLCNQYQNFADLALIVIGRSINLKKAERFEEADALEKSLLDYTIQYLNFTYYTPYRETFTRNLLEGISQKISGQAIDLQAHVYGNTAQVYYTHEAEIRDLVFHNDWKAFWESLQTYSCF